MSLTAVAAAVGGRLCDGADPRALITGPVVADSRRATAGSLFVALPGDRVDGHDFAAQAHATGAVAVLATRPTPAPTVIVDDPLRAVGLLARAVCDQLPNLTVIALTGSSGKTSTKDLLAQLLPAAGPVIAPVGSHNNELGLPLTALRCDLDTRYLVAEMGARRPGNLRYLCGITPPQISVVLNVGTAHAGIFGSRQATAGTKAEIIEALPPDGVAVLNADDPLVRPMAALTRAKVIMVGCDADADHAQVRACDIQLDPAARARFTLTTAAGSAEVRLQLHGAHHVSNALAAAAVALECGVCLADVARLLSQATPNSRWRMELIERADGVVLINDAYNANPESMRAALQALVAMSGGRRTWAVLGEMLELGNQSERHHGEIGLLAARSGISRLLAVGPGAQPYHTAFGAAAEWLPDREAALQRLREQVRPGDVVLVKASRSVGLEQLVAALAGDVTTTMDAVSAGPGQGRR